jgi:hypothetical protein
LALASARGAAATEIKLTPGFASPQLGRYEKNMLACSDCLPIVVWFIVDDRVVSAFALDTKSRSYSMMRARRKGAPIYG